MEGEALPKPKLTSEIAEESIRLVKAGASNSDVIAYIGVTETTFYRWLREAKCVEIAESQLSAKDNEMLIKAIDKHWEFINSQISKTFRGEKTRIKNIEK